MHCEVCNTSFNAQEADIAFCPQCGWPLSKLSVTWDRDPVPIIASQKGEVVLTITNIGVGRLKCRLLPLTTPGVTQRDLLNEWTLAQEPFNVHLCIDPALLPQDITHLPIQFIATDARGSDSTDFRPQSLDHIETTHDYKLPVTFRRRGPVYVRQSAVFFRRLRREQQIHIVNNGQTEETVTVTAPEGFEVCRGGQRNGKSQIRFTILHGGMTERVEIFAPPMPKGSAKSQTIPRLKVECEGIANGTHEVQLLWLPDPPLKIPAERWIIGIDFGTAKTAVFVVDTHADHPTPVPITWRYGNAEHMKMPSVILYPSQGGRPLFGGEVPANPLRDDKVIRSIKKRLIDDTPYEIPPDNHLINAEKIVEDYLRFLIEHVRRHVLFGKTNPFENAQIVMSLPVHDKDKLYTEQAMRTLRAATKAGLKESKIKFYTEPECAAVDFLRRREELGLAVKEGHRMLVFDSGAGTTDICVLRVSFVEGEPQFTRIALAGFPIGGDLIDELLADAYLERFPKVKDLPSYRRSSLVNTLRNAKQTLSIKVTDADTSALPSVKNLDDDDDEPFVISWQLIEEKYQRYIDGMLKDGFRAGTELPGEDAQGNKHHIEQDLPSLDGVLWDAETSGADIQWLCLTGGSSFIPAVQAALHGMFPQAEMVPSPEKFIELQSSNADAPFTLNVAQGAASRPLFRVEGQIQASFDIRYESPSFTREELNVIPQGTMPDYASDYYPFVLAADETATLRISGGNGTDRQVLYTIQLPNPDSDIDRRIHVRLSYRIDLKVALDVQTSKDGVRESLVKDQILVH